MISNKSLHIQIGVILPSYGISSPCPQWRPTSNTYNIVTSCAQLWIIIHGPFHRSVQQSYMAEDSPESKKSNFRPQSNGFRPKWSIVNRAWPVLAGAVLALLVLVVYGTIFPAPEPASQDEIEESIIKAIASATAPAAFSADVYQSILPSLVFIQAAGKMSLEEDTVGVGAGVVINDKGDILTAFHVISGAAVIEVAYADGSVVEATVIATEPENDIAVLHPNQSPELIVPAVLGNPNAMRIGDEAFAVGNPLGLAGSMSSGVISGFNRSLPADAGEKKLEGLIQFDAAVNPGNSGGPLLNRNGQVIGIVTALANPSDQNFFIGIGFAVPIMTAVSAAGGPDY